MDLKNMLTQKQPTESDFQQKFEELVSKYQNLKHHNPLSSQMTEFNKFDQELNRTTKTIHQTITALHEKREKHYLIAKQIQTLNS